MTLQLQSRLNCRFVARAAVENHPAMLFVRDPCAKEIHVDGK